MGKGCILETASIGEELDFFSAKEVCEATTDKLNNY